MTVINTLIGNDKRNTISATSNDDHYIIAKGGNDTLYGLGGNDTLNGGSGSDSMIGGDNNDVYYIDRTTDKIYEEPSQGIDTVLTSVSYSLGINIENLTLTGREKINAYGNELINTITGNTEAGTLKGYGDNDVYVVKNSNTKIAENSGEGIDLVQSIVSYTISDIDVENLILTGSSNIRAVGNASDNSITGNSGRNVLNGKAGDDVLNGQGGNDTYSFTAGFGNDTITGDTIGANILDFSTILTAIEVDMAGETATTGNDSLDFDNISIGKIVLGKGNDSVIFAENDLLAGNTLTGGSGIDTLDFSAFTNDIILNLTKGTISSNSETLIAASFDKVIGGSGNDTYIVQDSSDIIQENISSGTDTVRSSVSYTISDIDIENLILTGTNYINATGNASDNILEGNLKANILTGKAGNDIYIVQNTSDRVIENSDEGIDTVQSSVTYSLRNYVENLELTGTKNIKGKGNSLNNIITGNLGINTLTGYQGDDIYVVQNYNDVIVENNGTVEGFDTVQSSVSYTLSASNVENLTLAGSDNINADGSGGNNTIIGNSGNNIINGNGGNDTINGAGGNDTYVFDWYGNNTIIGDNEGINIIDFSAFNYTTTVNLNERRTNNGAMNSVTVAEDAVISKIILGAGDDDVIFAANDFIVDTIEGGNGTDSLDFTNFTNAITANLSTGVITSNSHTLITTGIEAITGGSGNDTISGSSNADNIDGGAGDDIITGSDNADTITGGSGDDTITGGAGDDSLAGGDGNDTYIFAAGFGNDAMPNDTDGINTADFSSITNDLIITAYSGGYDTNSVSYYGISKYIGGTGNDSISGSGNADTIIGGAGDDTIAGGDGNDSLVGGAGNNTYYFDSAFGKDTISGSSSNILDFSSMQAGLTIELQDGIGYSGMDPEDSSADKLTVDFETVSKITLGLADDHIIFKANEFTVDTLIGGGYNDSLDFSSFTNAVNINLSTGTITSNSETLIGQEFEIVTGGSGNDNITGSSGVDSILGGAGNDTITGGAGNDKIYGEGGNNTYIFEDGCGNDTITGNSVDKSILDFSAVTSAINANIASTNPYVIGDNILKLYGSPLSKIIFGSGNDNYTFNWNAFYVDSLVGGSGIDSLAFSDFSYGINANLSTGTITASSGTVIATGFEKILAGSGNDNITGTNNADTISGGNGNDTINGGAGNDSLLGGDGNDIYVFGSGFGTDTITETIGNDSVDFSSITDDLAINSTSASYTGNTVTYSDIEKYIGGSGNDSITGSNNADTIIGNAGNDTITGGAGNDSLVGGTGNNTYIFAGNFGVDTISGNGTGTNILDFSDLTTDILVNLNSKVGMSGTNSVSVSNAPISRIILGSGNDTITFPANDTEVDTLIGGAGIDYLNLSNFTGTVIADLSTNMIMSGSTMLIASGFEKIQSGTGNDSLIGSSYDDTIIGGNGDDTLKGEGGNDTYSFALTAGQDLINDSAGAQDKISFDSSVDKAKIALFVDGSNNLIIDYGTVTGNDRITVLSQNTNTIEKLELNDGKFLTSENIVNIINYITTYDTNNTELTISSVNDVKSNTELMTYISGQWHT